jgi:hypothetical protein
MRQGFAVRFISAGRVSTRKEPSMSRPLLTPALLARAVAAIGVLMIVVGGFAFYLVHDELADARITVSDNASFLAGDRVDGPFSAFAQAQVIEKDALASTDGKT